MGVKNLFSRLVLFYAVLSFGVSCSKSDSDGTPVPPVDKCAAKTIAVTTASTASSNCGNTGGITVTATGSTNFTYRLGASGAFQASNTFGGVAAGTHTIFVKDGDGCEKTASVTVTSSGQAGTLFTQVRSLLAAKCVSCHNANNLNGGMNWEVDCNIVANQGRIKVRAVDEGTMPPGGPLSAAEKKIITDWIAAGGSLTN